MQRELLILKLKELKGICINSKIKENYKKEKRIKEKFPSKIIEYYERNKNKESLEYLYKTKNTDIEEILLSLRYLNASSPNIRKILLTACLSGVNSIPGALYIISNQTNQHEAKRILKLYLKRSVITKQEIIKAREDIYERTKIHTLKK